MERPEIKTFSLVLYDSLCLMGAEQVLIYVLESV